MRETGFFGGTFNPLHLGHVALARHIMEVAHLEEVWFVVSPLNPFKASATHLLPDEERLRLAQKALADQPHLVVSDCEMHLPRPSFTYRTLRMLRAQHPDRRFTLIIGADNWLAFSRWAHHEEILAHHRVVIYPRPHCPVDAATLPVGVTLVDAPLHTVSSTEVRQRVAAGASLQGLVPATIEEEVRRLLSLHT